MEDDLIKLLGEIKRLSDISKTVQKEKRSRGETFNFFQEMNMSTDEVHLHSAFLAMLLNSQSSHGQKGKYLKSFIELLDSKTNNHETPFKLNADDAVAYVEKDIGRISGEYGGRIDIYITDKKKYRIIIENKIYAGDQTDQMKRYWNFAQEKCNKDKECYRLVYLTLDGHAPGVESTKDLNPEDFICLSYQTDIIPWLETCLEHSARLPLIRETIYQYIDILKQLTYSYMDKQSEILQIMAKKEYLDSVFEIAKNLSPMIDNIMNNILYPQLQDIAQSKGLELFFNKRKGWMTESWAGWSFVNPKWKHFKISMEFEKKELGELIIGYTKLPGQHREDIKCWDDLWKKTTKKNIRGKNENWIYVNFPTYPNWNDPNSLKAITDGSEMKNKISKMLDTLISQTEGFDV